MQVLAQEPGIQEPALATQVRVTPVPEQVQVNHRWWLMALRPYNIGKIKFTPKVKKPEFVRVFFISLKFSNVILFKHNGSRYTPAAHFLKSFTHKTLQQ
jgi:hypothetical protein